MRKLIATTILTLALLGWSSAASADATPAAGTWDVSHGTAAASGTARFEGIGFVYGNVILEGTNTNSGSGCYYARLAITYDIRPVYYESGEVCGTGSAPVNFKVAVASA